MWTEKEKNLNDAKSSVEKNIPSLSKAGTTDSKWQCKGNMSESDSMNDDDREIMDI